MTPFAYINEVAFCFTMIAYLLSAIVGVVCFAMSTAYKLKPQYVLPELIVSLAAVFLFSSLSDGIRIRYLGEDPSGFVGSPCLVPTWIVVVIAVVLFVEVSCWLVIVVRKRLLSLTAMSVKEAIAELPVGLCFYDETGRVLLLNEQIAHDSKELTGEPLYDGNAFWSSVSKGDVLEATVTQDNGSLIVERADGRVAMCRRITHDMDDITIYELCSTDISREFMLKKEMEQKNENLRKMNLRLRKYGEIVAEVAKEKETLATRIKVHGNLGSLILRTEKELMQGEYDRASLIAAWNDILSLILVTDDDEQDRFFEADKTASSVGVHIFYDGKRPGKGTQAERIFATAVSECVTNAARHADGTELYVKMTESGEGYAVMLTNDGRQPDSEIKEGGGLSSLRTMVENAGGRMTVESLPRFALSITVPKEM